LFRKIWWNRAAVALQIAFGLVMLVYNLHQSNNKANLMLATRNTPLYGIWTVDDFSVGAVSRPPLLTDDQRWRRLIIDSNDSVAAQGMTGAMQYLHFHPDPRDNGFSLTRYGDPGWIAEFSYDNSKPDSLVLRGRMGGQPTTITLHREDESQFLLTSRGFHWIQEMSVNQ
jgi:hypothetical protein